MPSASDIASATAIISIPPRTAVIDLVPEFRPTISPMVVITPEVAPKNNPVRAPSLLKSPMLVLSEPLAVKTNCLIIARHCQHIDKHQPQLFNEADRRGIARRNDRGQLLDPQIVACVRQNRECRFTGVTLAAK